MTPQQKHSAVRSILFTIAAATIVAVPAMGFFSFIDRYPSYYVDEPFYNMPAVNYLSGRGYHYVHSPDTPWGETIWGYNGPFFPRLQALSFSRFGSNLTTWRLPDLLCGNLAIIFLVVHLIRNRKPWSGVLLATLWVGDRTFMELLLGRPDGVCLLFLTLAFLSLQRIGSNRSHAWAFLSGLFVATACGFHFTAAAFLFLCFFLAILFARPAERWSVGLTTIAGCSIPLACMLFTWYPLLSEHIEQLRWHLRLPMPGSPAERALRLFATLRWSRFWLIVLLICWVCSVYAVAKRFKEFRDSQTLEPDNRRFLTAVTFGLAGFVAIFNPRAMYPYYLIYFTPWALMLLIFGIEQSLFHGRIRVRTGVITALCAAAFVPSMAWNLVRFREAVLHYHKLDQKEMVRLIHETVPEEGVIVVQADLVAAAMDSGRKIELLNWSSIPVGISPTSYLLLREATYLSPEWVRSRQFADRTILFQGGMFPGAKILDQPVVILSPVKH